jgi:UDP-2,4-diacetamido-2,4,6-trideoxy-beta-L-altropyranose hydrolase
MRGSGRDRIHLRRAIPEDCDRVYRWRNHPSARKFSANTKRIDLESHRKWFRQVLRSRKQVLLIAVKEDEAVGVIRFDMDRRNGTATISIYVKPRKHHTGIGTEMMKEGEVWLRKRWPSVKRIFATVRKENVVSLRLFKRADFEPAFLVFCKEL